MRIGCDGTETRKGACIRFALARGRRKYMPRAKVGRPRKMARRLIDPSKGAIVTMKAYIAGRPPKCLKVCWKTPKNIRCLKQVIRHAGEFSVAYKKIPTWLQDAMFEAMDDAEKYGETPDTIESTPAAEENEEDEEEEQEDEEEEGQTDDEDTTGDDDREIV